MTTLQPATERRDGRFRVTCAVTHHLTGADVLWVLAFWAHRDLWFADRDLGKGEIGELIRDAMWAHGHDAHHGERDIDDYTGRDEKAQLFTWAHRQVVKHFPKLRDDELDDTTREHGGTVISVDEESRAHPLG